MIVEICNIYRYRSIKLFEFKIRQENNSHQQKQNKKKECVVQKRKHPPIPPTNKMSVNPVDKELLTRIYKKFAPDKLSNVDSVLSKRAGRPKDMADMWAHLGTTHKIDCAEWRAKVEKDLKAGGGGATATATAASTPAKSPATSTASPNKRPASPAVGSSKTAPDSPKPTAKQQPAASSPAPSQQQKQQQSQQDDPETAALEAQTVLRVQRLLMKESPEKAANAAALVQSLYGAKGGLTEKSANQLIKSLEKRLGVTEAELLALETGGGASASTTPTPVATGGKAGKKNQQEPLPKPTSLASAFGMSEEDQQAQTAALRMKPYISRVLADGFGLLPETQRPSIYKRIPLRSAEERLFYEELFKPSLRMAVGNGIQQKEDMDEAMRQILMRAEGYTLTQKMMTECTTVREVLDRVLRALQSKYEHRNPAGRDDFFARFLPRSHQDHLKEHQQQIQKQQDSMMTAVFMSADSSPMAMSRLIAQNTLASSLVSSTSFLGEMPPPAAGDDTKGRNSRNANYFTRLVEGGARPDMKPDLGHLPNNNNNENQQPTSEISSSFTAMLTSAMKFLDSSSIETVTPYSDKEILPATFVIECLDWNDITGRSQGVVVVLNQKDATHHNNNINNSDSLNTSATAGTAGGDINLSMAHPVVPASTVLSRNEHGRELFKLALSRDIAEVLGWGELLTSSSSRHNWRNVTVKKFTLTMAGNVMAEIEIVIPAGIVVEDLKSIVYSRLRSGGFTLPRSRISLARDLEARPAKLFCRSATFADSTAAQQESIVPETVFDETLGVHISPHRNRNNNSNINSRMPQAPVQGVERGVSLFL